MSPQVAREHDARSCAVTLKETGRIDPDHLAELLDSDFDITTRLGAPWIPATDFEAFAAEVMGTTTRLRPSKLPLQRPINNPMSCRFDVHHIPCAG